MKNAESFAYFLLLIGLWTLMVCTMQPIVSTKYSHVGFEKNSLIWFKEESARHMQATCICQ